VTTLFCDLVEFTALSESADPEDVDAVLHEYGARAREVVEAYGGVVEKFIGDAVVAIFGVPAGHEDDAERAVRAGLRLVEKVAGLSRPDGGPLEFRVGINTGEALVRLDVEPGSGGGFLTGDAVNTAARLQSVAPPMGVVVGESTHELTAAWFEYEELEPATLKGKAAPVRAWLTERALARTGLRPAEDYATRLVGREQEVGVLSRLFEDCLASGTGRSVLIVGEPGIGKSRLIAEFGAVLDRRPELIVWRTGSCPPYGDGPAFAPLAEVVKAESGVLDTDDPELVAAKLAAVLPEGPDTAWLASRLRPLLGLDSSSSSGREENFAAWRRFLRHIAERGPAVVVFEDLHWAGEGLLGFLREAVREIRDVPLLLIASARPPLLERSPEIASGEAFGELVDLRELAEPEAGELVAELLAGTSVQAAARAELSARCGGHPLFAEELVRLLDETGALEGSGAGPDADGVRLSPTSSVQALIAARLDTLPPESKAVLADAAVVGRTFWPGAVASIGGLDRARVEEVLEELTSRRFVRRVPGTSLRDQVEFSFWHALTRDVAYAQLPRDLRARRHAAAADWLEDETGVRLDDVAEVLALHTATALELARASGEAHLCGTLPPRVVRFSSLAGDHAMSLDLAAAERHYRRALDLIEEDDATRPRLLVHLGRCLLMSGRLKEAGHALQEGIAGLKAAGDNRTAAVATRTWSVVLFHLDDPRYQDVVGETLGLLEGEEPGPELVRVVVGQAGALAMAEDHLGTLHAAERAIELSRRLGLPEDAEALGFRGGARCDLGDAGGVDDCRRAIAAAEAQGLALEAANITCNLGVSVFGLEGPRAALAIHRDGLESVRRRSMGFLARAFRMQVLDDLVWAGDWDDALVEALALEGELLDESNEFDHLLVLGQETLLAVWRGDADRASLLADALAGPLGATDQPVLAATCLVPAAAARLLEGRAAEALGLLAASSAVPHVRDCSDYACRLPEAVRVAVLAGDRGLAARLAAGVEPRLPVHADALAAAEARLLEADGAWAAAAAAAAVAAEQWRVFGVPYEEGQALLGCGRCLIPLGRDPEAAAVLTRALGLFEAAGAAPARTEAEALLRSLRSGTS
jgi:class 3 adenylate cyclase